MRPALRFPLAEVLVLAEHAVAAADHASPVGDEPDGPALLLVADDSVYVMSNGHRQLPPTEGQPASSRVRAVFAEGYSAGTPWRDRLLGTGSEDDLLVGLPLLKPHALIDQLRDAAERGYDILTIDLHLGQITIGVTRRERSAGG
jgi:hypothetical protein